MKAIILEIYRKYCILMTEDGQFIRKDIPAGLHEIGDEIIIDRFEEVAVFRGRKLFRVISGVAVGIASVALIIAGSYFGVKFLREHQPVESAAVAEQPTAIEQSLKIAEDTIELKSENAFQGNTSRERMAAEVAEAVPEATISPRKQSADISQAANKLFEGSYSLEDTGIDIPITFAGMNIIYRVDEVRESFFNFIDRERKLNFNFENINTRASFNGNIDINLLNKDLGVTKTHTILFDNFGFGQEKSEVIPLMDELGFRLIMYGFFE